MASLGGLGELLASVTGWITGSGNLEVRGFPIEGFARVQVSSAVSLQVTRGESFTVSVEADDNLWDRIRVEKEGDALRIGLEPGVSFRRMTVRASVTMPTLLGLDMSGASSGTISGFSSLDSLDLRLSGASSLKGDIASGEMTVDLRGASGVFLTGSAEGLRFSASGGSEANLSNLHLADADVRLGGASKATFGGLTTQLRVDAAGGSQVAVADAGVGEAEVRLSGASTVALTGSGERLRLDASGASHARLAELQVVDAEVRLEGGSDLTVHVTHRLDASASGASSIRYTGGATLGTRNTSGASTIRPA